MYVVNPITVTDSILYNVPNVPENDHPVFNLATSYSIGDKVIVTTAGDHHIYTSLVNANIGNNPKTNPTKWNDNGAVNRWKMFDNSVSSQTVANGVLTFALRPAQIVNSIGFINLDATEVAVEVKDGAGNTVYTNTVSLRIPNAISYYTWVFQKIEYKRFLVLNDLPPYADATIYVTINPAPDGYSRVGFCMIGLSAYLGYLQYDSGGGIQDFSTVSVFLGEATFVPRTSAAKLTGQLWVDAQYVDNTVRVLSKLPATVCLWAGSDDYDSSNIVGYMKDFTFSYKSVSHSIFNIEILGIT